MKNFEPHENPGNSGIDNQEVNHGMLANLQKELETLKTRNANGENVFSQIETITVKIRKLQKDEGSIKSANIVH